MPGRKQQLTRQPRGTAPTQSPRQPGKARQPTTGDVGVVATPGVTFHKRMTAGKQALLARSPLSRLIPAAAGSSKRAREHDNVDVGGEQPDEGAQGLDDPAAPSTKRPKPAATSDADREALREERRERKREKKAARRREANGDADDVEPGAGVVYLGHVPHGFYEKQIQQFFAQFGQVNRVKLSRSRKTAKSRGYAFVEFSNAQVAKIAAEAMDGYLMFGRALAAKFLLPENLHPNALDGAGRRFRRIPWASIERHKNIEAAKDPVKLAARAAKVAEGCRAKQQRLSARGIEYTFPTIPTPISSK